MKEKENESQIESEMRSEDLNQTKGGGQYAHENDRNYLERQRRYAPCVDINSMRVVKSATRADVRGTPTSPTEEEKIISDKLKIISRARAL